MAVEAQKFFDDLKTDVSIYEHQIDGALKNKKYRRAYGKIHLDNIRVPYEDREEVKNLYKKAGWKMEFHSDQREGDWITMSRNT